MKSDKDIDDAWDGIGAVDGIANGCMGARDNFR